MATGLIIHLSSRRNYLTTRYHYNRKVQVHIHPRLPYLESLEKAVSRQE